MKIREGFVTNSSSTNFLIISKEELSVEYLYHKLGFKDGSPLEEMGKRLCAEIMDGATRGPRWFDFEEYNYDNIKEAFGQRAAEHFKRLTAKKYHVYAGHTNSESDWLTAFFTTDSFEIDEQDFFLDGKNCMW